MRRLPFAIALLAALCAPIGAPAAGQERPSIYITDPADKTLRIAVQRFRPARPGSEEAAASVHRSLEAGLAFSGLFSGIESAAFLGPAETPPLERGDPLVCPNWRQIGADALLQAEVESSPTGVRAQARIVDVPRGCTVLLHKRYRGSGQEVDRIGRAMADDVVAAFTGQPGVADTEIAFVSNRTGAREVHVMNVDGSALRAATSNRSINAFPSWDPDGDSIVYTSYRHRARPSLFLLTRGTRSPGRILRDVDSGAPLYRGVFSPRGETLAFVMSVDGAAEIFTSDVDGGRLRRLTRDRAIDISPSWSPDGERMAFVSDRAGGPQVYLMNRDGSGQRRLTFEGSYNTSPAWSPDGRWIAYERRVNGQFDIWLVDPEGGTHVPLVSHPRSDEHPTWAPDGRWLAFASPRRGRSDIYVVDLAGRHLRRLTSEGENTNPAWGPYRR